MKRKKRKEYKIKLIWPRFCWHFCELCKQEFKREYGWKVFFSFVPDKFVCYDCCPTQKELEKRIDPDLELIITHLRESSPPKEE